VLDAKEKIGRFCMLSKKWSAISAILLALLVLSLSLSGVTAQDNKSIILATTTSTQDSGLLDVLIPAFEKHSGCIVKTISVGSGQALKMGERGEADVLLAHSPDAEKKLVEQGFAINRRLVMHNDFVVVGPASDPARIKGIKSIKEAFKKIAGSKAPFFSRGDNSGTHVLETKLWKAAEVSVEGQPWYQQTGLGMGQTLNVSSEKRAYTIADRGTFLSLKKTLGLEILVEGDALLLNVYHVMEVNPAKWPKVNAAGSKAFADFVVSKKAQDIIRKFGIDKFGSALFFPDAGRKDMEMY
jgi:tungstate transport system substrate-binding protein